MKIPLEEVDHIAKPARLSLAEDQRLMLTKQLNDILILVTPVAPIPAFRLGEKIDDPLTMYLSDIFTIPPNLAGIPCMSIPCGMSSSGLPIGVQILGNYFDELTLMQTAYVLEEISDVSQRNPPRLRMHEVF